MTRFERVYLDLDRTLFDTDLFSDTLFTAVENIYGISAGQFHKDMPNYFIHHGALRYYDFFAHVTALGLDPQEVQEHAHRFLRAGDFMFADAHLLLKTLKDLPVEISIVSFGPSNYQDFKVSFLPDLHRIPLVTILENKAAYLAAQDALPTLLVDDRVVAPLPSWCTQYIIDRESAAEKTKESPRLWRINTLRAVETALELGYNEPNQKGTTDEAD